jgi:hypothetical protein
MKKIVLIGDSIRQGYDKYVKMAFEGVAQVYYPNENCRFASYILRNLVDWKEGMKCGDDVDLVHWNAGVWDNLILMDNRHHTEIDVYKSNVERICQFIKILFPNAKMIFATSTPVDEELFRVKFEPKKMMRLNSDTEIYNQAAVEIVRKQGGDINDLYGLLKDRQTEYHSDQTHFYTKEGTRVITNQVIEHIEKALNIKAKPLDYDLLFGKKEDAIGM